MRLLLLLFVPAAFGFSVGPRVHSNSHRKSPLFLIVTPDDNCMDMFDQAMQEQKEGKLDEEKTDTFDSAVLKSTDEQKQDKLEEAEETAPKTSVHSAVLLKSTDGVMDEYDQAVSLANSQDSVMKNYDKEIKQSQERVTAPMAQPTTAVTTKNNGDKDSVFSGIAYLQTLLTGAIIGPLAVFPYTAFRYLYYTLPYYQTYAQWEFDLAVSVLQGALFATVYRYALRNDVYNDTLKTRIVTAFVLTRSLVRVEVPMECAAGKNLPLYCAEPVFFADWTMLSDLAMNTVEAVALFGSVAAVLDWLLQRNWIRKFPD